MITPHEAALKLSVEHLSPALIGEWYPVKVMFVNDEPFAVSKLNLKFFLDTPEGFADGG